METNGDHKVATMEVAAMEARATEVAVATNLKAAMEDQAAVVVMEVVVATVEMTTVARAEVLVAMAEATMLAALLEEVVTGEVATRTQAPAEEVVTAVAMVAAVATTTTKIDKEKALHMEVVHHRTSQGLSLVVVLSLLQVVAATRSSSATSTSLLTRTL